MADLVLLNEQPSSYFEELNQQLLDVVRSSDAHDLLDKPGGSSSERPRTRRGGLGPASGCGPRCPGGRTRTVGAASSIAWNDCRLPRNRWFRPGIRNGWTNPELTLPADLEFANGLGRFHDEGQEYCVLVRAQPSAAPRSTADRFPSQGCR